MILTLIYITVTFKDAEAHFFFIWKYNNAT